MTKDADHEELLALFDSSQHDLKMHMEGVQKYIAEHPDLNMPNRPIIHSSKSRLKNRDHLKCKIEKKICDGRNIDSNNFFQQITDLAGVRILHLFQEDFGPIDTIIRSRVAAGDWALGETPKAYTWDPEAAAFFENFDLEIETKSTFYTSVHYLIRPREDSPFCCEVQVRTLFEEIWGEVDHQINYPEATNSLACREQLKVLSKVVGTGSRLLDAIRRVEKHEQK